MWRAVRNRRSFLPSGPMTQSLAGDAQGTRRNSYFYILFAESRHFSTDAEFGFRLCDVHRDIQQDFGLRTEPVLLGMAMRESAGFKQLVGTAGDQVIDLLCEL